MRSHSGTIPFHDLYDDDFDDFIEEVEAYWEEEEVLPADALAWEFLSDGEEVEIEEAYETESVAFIWASDYLILAVLVIVLCGAGLLGALNGDGKSATSEVQPAAVNLGGRPFSFQDNNATVIIAPYKEYKLTQGLHGQSYGHLAVDLAAGRGEPVLSPINGRVTDYYIDEYSNTTLVIENEVYLVTMLHGDYDVALGDELQVGQVVGTEGNNGYTKDYWGNLCYGRVGCGNHTHLNIFDKRLQANVNPLDLIQ